MVAADQRSPRDGRFIEEIGYYDPRPDPPVIKFDDERVQKWLRSGAIPSPTVATLISRAAGEAK